MVNFTRLISYQLFRCQSLFGKAEIWASWMNRSEYNKFYLGCILRLRSLSFLRQPAKATNQSACYCCCDVRGWSVSCRKVAFSFLFAALWKLCVKVHILKYRHPAKLRKLLPRWNCLFVCCASKKCFSSVVCRGICENVVDFNQRWRPFILWMLWLQHVWLCVDCRSEKMQVARRVLQPSRAFAPEQEFLAKTANYREYLRGFLCKRPHCE